MASQISAFGSRDGKRWEGGTIFFARKEAI